MKNKLKKGLAVLLAGTILDHDFTFAKPRISDRIAGGRNRPAIGLQSPVRAQNQLLGFQLQRIDPHADRRFF